MTNNNLQEAWERLPLVKLEKAIKQNMIHPTHLFPDFSYFCRTGKPPENLKIYVQLHQCPDINSSTISIYYINGQYRIDGWHKTKGDRSSRLEKILSSIIERVKIKENRMLLQYEREIKEKEKAASISEEVGIPLVSSYDILSYNPDKKYGISFVKKTDDDDVMKECPDAPYKITEIRGQYTLEELKKIIEIVATNPRAIKEKLLNN